MNPPYTPPMLTKVLRKAADDWSRSPQTTAFYIAVPSWKKEEYFDLS